MSQLPILIVDDSEDTHIILSYFAKNLDQPVVSARTGEEGLDLLTNGQVSFIAALIDLNLPTMDGFELILKFREFEQCKRPSLRTPAFAFSTKSELDHNLSRITSSGFDGSIEKPTSQERLNLLLSELKSKKL